MGIVGIQISSTKIIWNSSTEKICLFLFIYLIMYLDRYDLNDIYFMLWVLILNYLFSCSKRSSFGHWEIFSWLLCPLDIFLSSWGFFVFVFAVVTTVFLGALPYFLPLQGAAGLPFISCPNPKSATSPKTLGCYYGRMVLETSSFLLLGCC